MSRRNQPLCFDCTKIRRSIWDQRQVDVQHDVNRVPRRLRLQGVMELRTGTLVISSVEKRAIVAGFDEQYLERRLKQAA